MNVARSCRHLRCTDTCSSALRAAFYSSRTEARRAEVLSYPPKEDDSKIAKFKERIAGLSRDSNTYKQKYETAAERSSRQDQELKKVYEQLRVAERERDKAQRDRDDVHQRLESLDEYEQSEDAHESAEKEESQVRKWKRKIVELSAISNTNRQRYDSTSAKLAAQQTVIHVSRKIADIAKEALENAALELGDLEASWRQNVVLQQQLENSVGLHWNVPDAEEDRPVDVGDSAGDHTPVLIPSLDTDVNGTSQQPLEARDIPQHLGIMGLDDSHMTSSSGNPADDALTAWAHLSIQRVAKRHGQASQVRSKALDKLIARAQNLDFRICKVLQSSEDMLKRHQSMRSEDKRASQQVEDAMLLHSSLHRDVEALSDDVSPGVVPSHGFSRHSTQMQSLSASIQENQHHLTSIKEWLDSVSVATHAKPEHHDGRREKLQKLDELLSAVVNAQKAYETTQYEFDGWVTMRDCEAGLITERDAALQQVDMLNERINEIQHTQAPADEVSERTRELEELYRKVEAMREERDDAVDQISELQASQKEAEAVEEERNELANKLDALEQKLSDVQAGWRVRLNKERDEAVQKIESVERRNEESEQSLKQQLQVARQEVEEQASKCQASEEALEKAVNERNELQTKLDSLEKQSKETQSTLSSRLGMVRKDLHQQESEIRQLRALSDDREKELRSARSKMTGLDQSHKAQLSKIRRDAEAEATRLRKRSDGFSELVSKHEDEISKLRADARKFRGLCLNQDINVIKRMLPSLPDPSFDTEKPFLLDAATRLANWLAEMDGDKTAIMRTQSVAKHDDIVRDSNILGIYTDGALFPSNGNKMGSSAIIPSLGYARIQAGAQDARFPVKSGMTELDGLMLALEGAADMCKDAQQIVVFSDYDAFATHDARMTWLTDLYRDETLRRAVDALHRLEKKKAQIRICWLARNSVEGARLAHQAARMGAMLNRGDGVPMVLSDAKWFANMSLQSLAEARDINYLSDIG
ncbi:MAG: hypothetical protein Q9162_003902 [Coniocarpon cinnabarinum]